MLLAPGAWPGMNAHVRRQGRDRKDGVRERRIGTAVRSWPQAAELLLFAVAYWVALRIGLLFVAHPEGVASIWPASGMALAILLLSPRRRWLHLLAVVFVVNAAGNWSGGNSLLVSLGFALANTLEALLAAWVLTHFCGSKITFGRTAEILALFGVAIASNGITALLGAAVPALAFGAPFLSAWWLWWTADGLGIILVTTVIVTWATDHHVPRSSSPARLAQGVLLILALGTLAWLLYGPFTVAEEPLLRNYMVFPLLILLAFRSSPRGMAGALLLFATIAVWNTLHGHGVFGFADQTVSEHLASVQVFLTVTTLSGLLLSAIVAERRRAEQALLESHEQLQAIIDNTALLVYTKDLDGRLTLVNRRLESLFGSREDIVGKTSHDLMSKKDADAHRANDLAVMAARAPISVEEANEESDGRHMYLSTKFPLLDVAGEVVGVCGISTDITERKQTEAENQQRTQELAHLNAELLSETAALEAANATITHIAATDDLTGLANRRHFYGSLERAVSLTRRHGSPLALVSFDLDGLKRVNDQHGHRAGDEVLAAFATLLGSLCRAEDLPARLGGDEFSLLMPGIDLAGGRGFAERVLAAVHSCAALKQHGVTVSGGAAAWLPDELPDDLLRRADEALYAAKRGGGDSVG
jgi:diguanylate cyclase (GGDEF)-like protein/PAS domain S-box-containing protein